MPTSATPEPVIRQIVEAMRTLAGPHPGFRPVHAKGVVCAGTFHASADAPRVSRAPHFTSRSVPTIVLFANADGARWRPQRISSNFRTELPHAVRRTHSRLLHDALAR